MAATKPIQFTTKTAISVALGVNRNTVTAWCLKPDFPGGGDGPWRLDEVVPWIIGRQLKRQPSDDPLLDGTDSPALERYRSARASLSEIELQQRQGRLVDVDDLAEFWATEIAAPIRRAIEGLQLRFGPEAAESIIKAIDKADGAVTKRSRGND